MLTMHNSSEGGSKKERNSKLREFNANSPVFFSSTTEASSRIKELSYLPLLLLLLLKLNCLRNNRNCEYNKIKVFHGKTRNINCDRKKSVELCN